MRIARDPVQDMLRAVREAYPEYKAEIHISVVSGALGETIFPEDGRPPQIHIDSTCTFAGVCDVLAHEVAHVIVEHNEHGPVWEDAYKAVQESYEYYIGRKYAEAQSTDSRGHYHGSTTTEAKTSRGRI